MRMHACISLTATSAKKCFYLLSFLVATVSAIVTADEGDASLVYERGLQSFNAGEYRAAVIHLKNALQQDPTMLSAQILLGRVYVEERAGSSAERELKIALDLGADPSLALPALANAYILQNKYSQLLTEILPNTPSTETNAAIFLLRGRSHMALGELDLANDAFSEAAALRPQDTAPLLGKAGVFLKRNDTDAAEATIKSAIELDATDPKAWLVKGTIAHGRGELEAALADYETVLSLEPQNEAARLARLGALMDLSRDEEAKKAAKDYRDDSPQDARVAYLLAVLATRTGDVKEARQALEDAYAILSPLPEEALKAHAPSALLAGVVSFSLGKLEEAHARLQRYVATFGQSTAARKLLGAVLMRQEDYAGAIDSLEPVLDVEPNNPKLLLMLGEAYMHEHRYQPAGELLERALRLRPDFTQARIQRALNRLAAGDEVTAIEELSDVFREQPEVTRVGALLVDLYLEQGNIRAAVTTAEQLVEIAPDNLRYRNRLALALLRSEKVAESREILEQILAHHPEHTATELNLAKLDLLTNNAPEASTRYERILDRTPNEPRAMIGLARALHAQGRTDAAIKLLDKVQSGQDRIANAHRIDAASYLVELLIKKGQSDRALQVAEQAELLAPADSRVIESLGHAYRARGENLKAQSMYRRLSTYAGYDAKRLFDIAWLQFLAEDLPSALWSISKAVEVKPSFLDAQVKQIELWGTLGKSEKALQAARVLANEQPDQPEAQRVLGAVLASTGDATGALNAYQQELALAPSPAAVIRVYRAHLALNQERVARVLLLKYLEEKPTDHAVRSILAEDYLRAGEWDTARGTYETLIGAGAASPTHYNNLALIYARDNDPRATQIAMKAHELDPSSAEINDTLGWILVRQGEVARGLGYLRKAEARAAYEPEIQYHLGSALHRLGRLDEARVALDQAVNAGKAFEGYNDAVVLRADLTPN